jgi:hypothetical protein
MESQVREDEEVAFELGSHEDDSQVGYVIFDAASLGRVVFGPDWEGPFHFQRGMFNGRGQLDALGKLLVAGYPVRMAARMTSINPETARKFRRVLEIIRGEVLKCGCGRDLSHPGACAFRHSLWPKESYDEMLAAMAKARETLAERRRIANEINSFVCSLLANIRLRGRWRNVAEKDRQARILAAFPDGKSIRRVEAWHRCSDPKPPWGVFLRMTKELARNGLLARDGSANNAPYRRVIKYG